MIRSQAISNVVYGFTAGHRLDREVLQSLVPLPETVLHLLYLLDDPDAALRDIAEAAARDVGLAARILRLANSAHFGLSRAVGDIGTALKVVGTQQARQIVLASGVMDLARGGLPFYGLSDRVFRQHCEQVGALSMFVARALQYGDMGQAYSAGLLHDMGKVVINALVKSRPELTSDVVADVVATCAGHLSNIEYAFCGTDHARAGSELAELWHLPMELSRAIAGHHTAIPDGSERSVLACVTIANALASALTSRYPPPNRVTVLPYSPVVDVATLLEGARCCLC